MGKHVVAVVTCSFPSDAAEEQSVGQSVVSRPRYGEMTHGGAPRDSPVSHSPLGFEHSHFEPERCSGLVVQ